MTQKNTRVRFIALQLMLMIVLQPFSALAGLSTPWFSYRLGGSSIAYPAGMKAPSDPLVVGFWVMAEPVDPLEYFEGHSNQYYFSAFQGGKYKAVLQHRLMLHDNGLGEYWVFQNVIGYKEAYPKALNAIGYKTDRGRLSIVFVTDSGTQSFFCPIFGVEDCKECQQYGGHKYTVTDTSLSLEYESVDGQHKTFVLTRWIPEKNTLSASEALKTYEIISVNRSLESWIQKRDALILSELACATGVHRLNPPVSKSGVKLWKPIEEFSNEKNKPLPEGYGLLCEKCMRTYNTKIDTTTHMNINCVWFSYSKLARYFVLTSASSVPKLRKWENGQEYKGYTVYTIKPDGEQWNGYYSGFYTQNKADGNKLLKLFDREDIGGLRAGDLILIVNEGHTYLIDSYQDGVFYYSDNGAASRAVMQGLVRYHQNPEKGFHPLPEDIEVYQKTPSELVKEYKQIKSRIVQITVFRPKTD